MNSLKIFLVVPSSYPKGVPKDEAAPTMMVMTIFLSDTPGTARFRTIEYRMITCLAFKVSGCGSTHEDLEVKAQGKGCRVEGTRWWFLYRGSSLIRNSAPLGS